MHFANYATVPFVVRGSLLGVLDGLGLPDEVDLDLAGVLHLFLDLLGDTLMNGIRARIISMIN